MESEVGQAKAKGRCNLIPNTNEVVGEALYDGCCLGCLPGRLVNGDKDGLLCLDENNSIRLECARCVIRTSQLTQSVAVASGKGN